LRAEKGRLRLSVEAENDDITQEVVYNLNEEGHDNGEAGEDKERQEAADNELRGDGEVPSGFVGVDGAARHDLNALHRQNLRRIHWNVPNVAWSMDSCEYGQRDKAGAKMYLNQMQDLASRYKFNPMTGDVPCGEEISGYLTATFNHFGAPLLLKRDNGGNLNHSAVNDTLA